MTGKTLGPDRTLTAAAMILAYAGLIGFTDNFVGLVAEEAGLWQFHATRTVLAIGLLALVARPLGLRLGMKRPRAVLLRSGVHGLAMVIYFGALAFLPVALVAAGLFTAPIFVLLIERLAFGTQIGPYRILAVALGFAGVTLVLLPEAVHGASLPALLPVLAGALYALGNIATRRWCAEESAETLLAGFFLALGLAGLLGMTVLTLWPQPVPEGAAGFLMRGPVWPGQTFWLVLVMQASASLLGIGLMVRAYQLADATRVSVFEYVILPASALWTWILHGKSLPPLAILGMAMIVAAGVMIALRSRQAAATSLA